VRRSPARSWAVTLGALVAALAVEGWFAPAAHATCGDYLAHPTDGAHPRHTMPRQQPGTPDMPGQHAPAAVPFEASGEGDVPEPPPCRRCPHEPGTPGKAPCEGPWCSDNHAPPPAPPTTIERTSDHWACLWSLLRPGTPDRVWLAFLREQSMRVHHVFPIYHPPRAA
jgi:hypothetical protein